MDCSMMVSILYLVDVYLEGIPILFEVIWLTLIVCWCVSHIFCQVYRGIILIDVWYMSSKTKQHQLQRELSYCKRITESHWAVLTFLWFVTWGIVWCSTASPPGLDRGRNILLRQIGTRHLGVIGEVKGMPNDMIVGNFWLKIWHITRPIQDCAWWNLVILGWMH